MGTSLSRDERRGIRASDDDDVTSMYPTEPGISDLDALGPKRETLDGVKGGVKE